MNNWLQGTKSCIDITLTLTRFRKRVCTKCRIQRFKCQCLIHQAGDKTITWTFYRKQIYRCQEHDYLSVAEMSKEMIYHSCVTLNVHSIAWLFFCFLIVWINVVNAMWFRLNQWIALCGSMYVFSFVGLDKFNKRDSIKPIIYTHHRSETLLPRAFPVPPQYIVFKTMNIPE